MTNERWEAEKGKDGKRKRGEGSESRKGNVKQKRQCVVNRGMIRHLRRIKTGTTIKVRRRYLPSSSSLLIPLLHSHPPGP